MLAGCRRLSCCRRAPLVQAACHQRPTAALCPRRRLKCASRASAMAAPSDNRDELVLPSGTELTLAQRLTRACPPPVQPYLQLMRLDRPIGSWLLFWPCGWGLAQAQTAGQLPDPQLLAVYAVGALLMRGAGCTINDLWDRDIDNKVERTRSRPITSGRVSPLHALILLSAQLSAAACLLLQLSWPAVQLGVSSLGLVLLYPLAKRVTHWPQLLLGLTFNWGVLMAWCSVQGRICWEVALPLYCAGVCWTIVYDTIYAHQDKGDDLALGIKSTALRFGDATATWLTGFASVMSASLLLAGLTANQTWPYYVGVVCVTTHVARQIITLKTGDAADCGEKFRSNRWVGLILFCSITAGRLLSTEDQQQQQLNPAEDDQQQLTPADDDQQLLIPTEDDLQLHRTSCS